jgi:hypothetical protein
VNLAGPLAAVQRRSKLENLNLSIKKQRSGDSEGITLVP